MEVGDRGAPAKYSFRALENEQFAGAASAELAVLFTREREPDAPPAGRLSLPAVTNGVSRILVAGLEKNGVYRVKDGEKMLFAASAGKGGVLEIELKEAATEGLLLERVNGRGR